MFLKSHLGFNTLSANPEKWSNTLKQFVGNFMNLALKGLSKQILNISLSPSRHTTSFQRRYDVVSTLKRRRVSTGLIHLAPKYVERVTLASCVHHKFLRKKFPVCYTPPGTFDREDADTGTVIEDWRLMKITDCLLMGLARINNYTYQCQYTGDNFFLYFNTAGNAVCQEKFV